MCVEDYLNNTTFATLERQRQSKVLVDGAFVGITSIFFIKKILRVTFVTVRHFAF